MPPHLAAGIYSIAPGRPFADDLAREIVAMVDDPHYMASAVIMLPNRQLVKSVQTAFLRTAGGKSQILPQLTTIGDVDVDSVEILNTDPSVHDLPPVIDDIERQLLLAALIRSLPFGKTERSYAESIGLARALGDFLDSVQTNALSLADLPALVTEKTPDLAEHWEKIVSFLGILTEHWPKILNAVKKSDRAAWRDTVIRARTASFKQNPPEHPIIIAGSTGSIPSTQELMAVVAGLPQGYVVLPGLDTEIDEEDWKEIAETENPIIATHPQYQLAKLLGALGVSREEVKPWPRLDTDNGVDDEYVRVARRRLLREMMRPPSQTPKWSQLREKPISREAVKNLSVTVCHDRRLEAETIALALRHALEEEGKTASLITADSQLARMVSGELRRWGIHVPISAGVSLADTEAARFLRLIAEAWASDFSPVTLLGMADHHLCCGGVDKISFSRQMHKLERRVMRGRDGLGYYGGGLAELLQQTKDKSPALTGFVENCLIAPLKPLLDIDAEKNIELASIAEAHCSAAENLAVNEKNPLKPWQGRAGNRLAQFFSRLIDGDSTHVIGAKHYPVIVMELMAGQVLYPDQELHPRLSIMGTIEARMHASDLIILGGINEGIMPPAPAADPWMSNHMRKTFNLPTLNWRIGMAAHDMVMMMAQPRVMITRAESDGRTPTAPSRWLRRMEATLKASGLPMPYDDTYHRLALTRIHFDEIPTPVPPPQPKVNEEERKESLVSFSATQIETLLRDPYAIYAKRILALKPLDPLGSAQMNALKGTIFHDAMRDFIEEYPQGLLPNDALEKLIKFGEKHLACLEHVILIKTFYTIQFKRMAGWFIKTEQQRRIDLNLKSFAEITGKMTLSIGDYEIDLTARADRIDQHADGGITVIDYKTGIVPSVRQVDQGYKPQMVVEAMIVRGGGFDSITVGGDIKLEYWKLSGKAAEAGKITPVGVGEVEHENRKEKIISALENVMSRDKIFASEIRPNDSVLRYSDYRHLARVLEWSENPANTDLEGDNDDPA